MTNSSTWDRCGETVAFLKERLGEFKPTIGIVLGSGLGKFGDRLEVVQTLSYADIPYFKPASVVGHPGNLIFGRLDGKDIICQQGRYHYYEGHDIQDTIFPIRVMHAMGVRDLIVSNAAGGINTEFRVGDIMLIRDHINFQGTNPLIGANDERFGPRFPDMSQAYAPEHAESVLALAAQLGFSMRQGVYISVTGPSYETPAEIRMFRALGADAVGMSTVNEVIAANHLGMRVLGLSCISNAAAGMGEEKLSHDDVGKVVGSMSDRFETLVETWIRDL